MAATPKNGTLTFIGLVTGRTYTKEIYRSDVADAKVNWDAGAGASASTDQFWLAPEPVMLIDVALITGTADTTKLQLTRNDIPTGDIFTYTTYLDSINNRPRVHVPFAAGAKIGSLQK